MTGRRGRLLAWPQYHHPGGNLQWVSLAAGCLLLCRSASRSGRRGIGPRRRNALAAGAARRLLTPTPRLLPR